MWRSAKFFFEKNQGPSPSKSLENTTLDLYSKGARFESQPGTPVILDEDFRVSSQTLHETSGIIPRLTHNRSLPNLYHSPSIRHPTIRLYTVCNADGAVKRTSTKTNIKKVTQISRVCYSFVGLDWTHTRTSRKLHTCCPGLHLTDS